MVFFNVLSSLAPFTMSFFENYHICSQWAHFGNQGISCASDGLSLGNHVKKQAFAFFSMGRKNTKINDQHIQCLNRIKCIVP